MAVSQSHYRFGVNEGTESTHGWYSPEDASPAPGGIPVDTTFLLRFTLQCDATLLSDIDAEFQYRKNGGGWVQITTGTSTVKAVTPTCWADGANTTKRLSGTGTFESSSAGCTADGIAGGTAFDIVASGNGETECALQLVGADLAPGDLLEFRLTRDGGLLLDTYAVTPTLQLREAVQRRPVVQGPFPFPKATPNFLPSVPSPDVTVALSGIAATVAMGAIGAALALGLSGAPGATTSTGSLSGSVLAYPEFERPKVLRGPFPFPKATPAFPISSPDKTVALVGIEAIATAGFLIAPPALVDRPVYVIGPAPFLTSGPHRFRERPRAVIITSDVNAGPLTSATATGAAGTLAPSLTLALTGHGATSALGSLTVSGDTTAAMTGVSATVSLGTPVVTVAPPLSGLSATGGQGSLAASAPGGATLAGLLAVTSLGSLTVATEAEIPAILGRGSYHRRITGRGSNRPILPGKGSLSMLVWHIDEDDEFFVGEDKTFPVTVYQADKRTLQNISGWSISWMLKASLADADLDALLTKTTASGIALTTPASGLCTITLADTDTDSLEPGRYYHEVKRTDAGNETVLSQGRFVLRRGVHRS